MELGQSAKGGRGGREEGMAGPLADVNGVTPDAVTPNAVTPLPAAQGLLENLTFDGHQLQCNMAICIAETQLSTSHLCWQRGKAPKGGSSF